MKRGLALIILACVAGLGFWATWGFLHGPRWALYQIGKSIYEHQPRLFLAYVDIERIARGQKDELVRIFLPERSPEEQKQVGRILGALMGPVTSLLKDKAARIIADPERDNLPSSWTLMAAARITRKDDYALVVLADPDSGRRLRLGMQRHPRQGHWQVVEVNPQDLRALLAEYLEKQGS